MLIANTSSAQRTVIEGELKNMEDKEIFIRQPFDDFQNTANIAEKKDWIPVGEDSRFKTILNIVSPSFITVSCNQAVTWLIVFPGDSLSLTITPGLNKNTLQEDLLITGNNSAGQLLFNKINHYPITKYIPVFDFFKRQPLISSSTLDSLNEIVKKTNAPFDSLLAIGQISSNFHHYITINIATLIWDECLKHLIRSGPYTTKNDPEAVGELRKKIFTIQLPEDPIIYNGLYSSLYIQSYYEHLCMTDKNLRNQGQIKDSILERNQQKYKFKSAFVFLLYCKNLMLQEKMWGITLYTLYQHFPEDYGAADIAVYKAFYPNSRYLAKVEELYNSRQKKPATKTSLAKQIHFLDTAITINSLGSLVKTHFPGKRVYIDLWATWCLPCRMEFGQYPLIEDFLDSNRVVKLFISLDKPEDKEKWKKSVASFNLAGYHLLANEALQDNINKLLAGKQQGINIPHYVMMDETGRVIDKNAPRPSQPDELRRRWNKQFKQWNFNLPAIQGPAK
jgi:thiol-disulfide isomerase/thioredoxin